MLRGRREKDGEKRTIERRDQREDEQRAHAPQRVVVARPPPAGAAAARSRAPASAETSIEVGASLAAAALHIGCIRGVSGMYHASFFS